MGATNLITLGIGAIIGAGIFVLTGAAAAQYAGPAIVLSFVLAGIACAFAGLCYAEFASLIPIAGSAYTYGYATLGEIFAWIIGWDLILEYAFGAATVASGWSGYVISFLQDFGIHIPPSLTATPGTDMVMYNGRWERLAAILPTLQAHGVDPATLPHVHGFVQPGRLSRRLSPSPRCWSIGIQGIGQFQLGDRDRQSCHRADVHWDRGRLCFCSTLTSPPRTGIRSFRPNTGHFGQLRLVRHRARGGGHLLRLHRL